MQCQRVLTQTGRTLQQPGMTPLSLVPEQARYAGIGYAELVELIVREAIRVHGLTAKDTQGTAHGQD